MKIHLWHSEQYPVPACKLSGRKAQNKGVLFGMSPKKFKEAGDANEGDCCTFCKKIYLKRRNAVRQKKGLPLVSTFNQKDE